MKGVIALAAGVAAGIAVYEGDLLDPESLASLTADADIIYNIAASYRQAAASRGPTRLACKVGPGTSQSWQTVLVLRQLNLQRALARVSVLCKNVEDDGGAVKYLHIG